MSLDRSSVKTAIKQPALWLSDMLGRHRFGGPRSQLWVLMYHRILPNHDPRYRDEEPGMIVTPDSFRQQLRIIKQLFSVIPLSEWVRRQAAGQALPERACAITFDDGWLDNFEFALPILQAEQIPATVFAVSGMIGSTRRFWPNRLADLLNFTKTDRASLRSFDWLQTLPGYQADEAPSREAIAQLIKSCKQLSDPELRMHLDLMETEASFNSPSVRAMMNWEELQQMQTSGLIEIGSHTCHHTRLVEGLPENILYAEIVESRKQLEDRLGKPVTLFCYPNGDVSSAAARLVAQHYSAAVTTQFGINSPRALAHQLQRIGIHDDISNTPTRFRARLSGWV